VRVHYLDPDPLPKLCYPTLVLRAGHVHRERDVERDHHRRGKS
jgi:hypothetical protein